VPELAVWARVHVLLFPVPGRLFPRSWVEHKRAAAEACVADEEGKAIVIGLGRC
jgi:hypothetical protein